MEVGWYSFSFIVELAPYPNPSNEWARRVAIDIVNPTKNTNQTLTFPNGYRAVRGGKIVIVADASFEITELAAGNSRLCMRYNNFNRSIQNVVMKKL